MSQIGEREDGWKVSAWSDQESPEVQHQNFRVGGTRDVEVAGSWGYRKCLDFDVDAGIGQDFCAVHGGKGFLAGVVADGVSQSYFGNIAARELGKYLLLHLWKLRQALPNKEDLEKSLKVLAPQVDNLVQETPAPPFLVDVLTPIRDKAGSQAVFAAFVLDFREGRRALSIYLCGDISVWVFTRSGRQMLKGNAHGRWASRGSSELHLTLEVFDDFEGLLVHSDGLRQKWTDALAGPSVNLESFVAEAEERAAVDDLAYIALKLEKPLSWAEEISAELAIEPEALFPSPQAQPDAMDRRFSSEAAETESPTPGLEGARIPIVPRAGDALFLAPSGPAGLPSWRQRTWQFRILLPFLAAGLIAFLILGRRSPVPGTDPPLEPGLDGEKRVVSDPEPTLPSEETSEIRVLAVEPRQLAKILGERVFQDFLAKNRLQEGDLLAVVELTTKMRGSLKVYVGLPAAEPLQHWVGDDGRNYMLLRFGPLEKADVYFEIVDQQMNPVAKSAGVTLMGRELEPAGNEHAFHGYYEISLNLEQENSEQ